VTHEPGAIGRYRVERRLGTGGMGAVYLARDPELDRLVAIKLVKDDLTDEPELRERFLREARAAARLRHPNIITIFDIGEWDNRSFIAMEYIEGESLADVARRQPTLDPAWVLRWMEQLCHGLAHAHRAGVVHRDIKPANLMIDREGTLKIVDFGIARAGESQLTKSGVLVGTANYLAPEQLLGTATDHRADIFAVGAVFYELLSGQKAFPGTIADGLFNRICYEAPQPLAARCPGLEPDIARIINGAIEKDPSRRYLDLSAMAADIAGVLAGRPITGPVPVAPGDSSMLTMPATPAPGGASQSRNPTAEPSSGRSAYAAAERTVSSSSRMKTDSPSERRRWADIMMDGADLALRDRDFAKARNLLDEAAGYDPGLPGIGELREQVEQQAAAVLDAERRHTEAEAALAEASSCLARGDFAAARALVRQAVTAEPTNFRAQSMVDRVAIAEASAQSHVTAAAPARKAVQRGFPWLRAIVIVSTLVSIAAIAYLATR